MSRNYYKCECGKKVYDQMFEDGSSIVAEWHPEEGEYTRHTCKYIKRGHTSIRYSELGLEKYGGLI